MRDNEERTTSRDRLLLIAELQVGGEANVNQVKVRDLSEGGMKAEGGSAPAPGTPVKVTFKQLGTISGKISWSNGMMFGVQFDATIDPKMARLQVSGSYAPAAAHVSLKRII